MRGPTPNITFAGWIGLSAVVCAGSVALWPSVIAGWLPFMAILVLPRKQFRGRPIEQTHSRFMLALVVIVVALAVLGIGGSNSLANSRLLYVVAMALVFVGFVYAGYRVFLLQKAP